MGAMHIAEGWSSPPRSLESCALSVLSGRRPRRFTFSVHKANSGVVTASRHWHDVARLDAAGFADAASADKALARAVAEHKSMFFAEKNMHGEVIDYHAAVAGGLQLVPDGIGIG